MTRFLKVPLESAVHRQVKGHLAALLGVGREANAPVDFDDLHVIGTMAPLIPGKIGCVAIHADGTRELARLIEVSLEGSRGQLPRWGAG